MGMNLKVKCDKNVNIKEYMEVRKLNDLTFYTEEEMKRSLENSLLVVSVYHGSKLIGVGRMMGDNTTSFFIRDIAVIPEYHGYGIGNLIMYELINYAKAHTIHKSYIALMATKGTETFYEKLGFTKRPNDKLGNGMVFYYEKE